MKKRYMILIILVLSVSGILNSGFAKTNGQVVDVDRFEVIYKQNDGLARSKTIYRDRQTGVEYLFVKNGYAGGLVRLEKQ